MKVLHFIYDDPANPWVAGGGAVRLRELYRHLSGRIDITVVTGCFPGARDETIDGIRYLRLGAAGPYARSRWSYAAGASRMMRRASYDVAVFDYSVYTPIRWPADRPVGLTVHHLTGPTARARWGSLAGRVIATIERRSLSRAVCISVTSRRTAELVREIVGPDVQLVPVGAGVPDRMFELEREEQGYLLYFGRLDWFQKGLDVLIDAFVLLLEGRPALQLKIAGRGKDLERVRSYAHARGVLPNISFEGAVDEPRREALFSGATVLLMPSRFEGFGMVAAEAMAAGLPVVAADTGSLPEVVSPPDGGMLVPPEDPAALARAVALLLDDPAQRTALGRSARRSAERFRWQVVAEDHLRFLNLIRRSRGAEHADINRHPAVEIDGQTD